MTLSSTIEKIPSKGRYMAGPATFVPNRWITLGRPDIQKPSLVLLWKYKPVSLASDGNKNNQNCWGSFLWLKILQDHGKEGDQIWQQRCGALWLHPEPWIEGLLRSCCLNCHCRLTYLHTTLFLEPLSVSNNELLLRNGHVTNGCGWLFMRDHELL